MYPDMNREEREKLMAKQCLKTEVADYSKPLTDDEIVAEQNGYTRSAMTLEGMEAEKKQLIAKLSSQIKALKEIMTEQLKVIQNGKRQVNGKLYLFPDQQGGVMRYYDVWGNIVNVRPLIPTERQTTLFLGEDGENKHVVANEHDTVDADFTIEQQEVDQQPAPGPAADQAAAETKPAKKRAAKRAKKEEPAAPGDDINQKVADMTANRKKAKAKSLNPNDHQPETPGPDEPGYNDDDFPE